MTTAPQPSATQPSDPVAAATHPDPYPWYAGLVALGGLRHDPAAGAWVAASAAAVEAVLTHPACRVRPPGEPVPPLLQGSAAGELFRRLARMNDGPGHLRARGAVSGLLARFAPPEVSRESRRQAAALAAASTPAADAARLREFAFALPAHVIAALLGFADDDLAAVAAEAGRLARAFAPGAGPAEAAAGAAAAEILEERFRSLLPHAPPAAGGAGPPPALANAIGLLTQAHDATAGLIGATLVALARHPGLVARLAAEPALLGAVVEEAARHDSPVQNTRRWLAEPATVAGVALQAGECVIVLLAAANRDPAANPAPYRFDPDRAERRLFTFGVGGHACPGKALAITIATAAVERLLADGLDPRRLDPAPAYVPSANSRIPRLRWRAAPASARADWRTHR